MFCITINFYVPGKSLSIKLLLRRTLVRLFLVSATSAGLNEIMYTVKFLRFIKHHYLSPYDVTLFSYCTF